MTNVNVKGRKATIAVSGNKLTVTFKHGAQHVVDVSAFSQAVKDAALLHGVRQTLQDSYAQKGTSEEAEGLFLKRLGVLQGGDWTGAREGGGGRAQERLILALMEVGGKSREEVEALFEGDKEAVAAVRKRAAAIPAVALIVKRIELEDAQARVEEGSTGEDALDSLFG